MSRPVIRLVEIPQPARPCSGFAVVIRNERPVFFFDYRPQLRRNTGGTDRFGIPRVRGFLAETFTGGVARLGELSSALLENAFAIPRNRFLYRFNQPRQRCFTVGSNRE